MATEHLDMWESLIGSRKSPLKQASIIGLGTLWQVFMRSITLDDLVEKVCKRIGVKGRAIVWPHAEACMDVDKPHQLELLRDDLEQEQRKALAKAKRAAKAKAKASAAKKSTQAKPDQTKSPAKAASKTKSASKTKTTTKTTTKAKTKVK